VTYVIFHTIAKYRIKYAHFNAFYFLDKMRAFLRICIIEMNACINPGLDRVNAEVSAIIISWLVADKTTDLMELPDVIITAAGDHTYVLLQCQLTVKKNTKISYHF